MAVDIKSEAERIFREARLRGIKLKFFGSVGIKFRCPTHARSTFDMGMVIRREDIGEFKALLKDLGYKFGASRRRRADMVFFKKTPFKVKIDVEVDGVKLFEEGYFIPLQEYLVKDDHPSLPSGILLVLKVLAPPDEDTAYDVICLLNEDPPVILEILEFLEKHPKIKEVVRRKIPLLVPAIQREPRKGRGEKFKALNFLKRLREALENPRSK